MKNFRGNGDVYIHSPTAAVSSGDVVVVGSIVGIASGDIAANGTGILQLCGIYEVDKTASQAWTAGALIYWDATNSKATTTAGSNKLMGVAWKAAEAADTEGEVRLNSDAHN